jgi:hypothetical protein
VKTSTLVRKSYGKYCLHMIYSDAKSPCLATLNRLLHSFSTYRVDEASPYNRPLTETYSRSLTQGQLEGDREARSVLMRLQKAAAVPYCRVLARWLYEGVVEDPYGELARWVMLRARWVALRARWVTRRARLVTRRARWVMRRARWGMLRARWVMRRARWGMLRARWVMRSARWGMLRARWVTFRRVPHRGA